MKIITGKIQSAQKVIVYGPEGIGKSTFAAQFPGALFIDTEGSTKHMDVPRFERPSSWTMLLEQVQHVRNNPMSAGTLVVDTADWAEILCAQHVCAVAKKGSIEEFGYGKGYVYLAEEFGRLLNKLDEVIENGTHVVLTGHAKMRKFEQPDEMGAYDRWEMKLSKQVAPMCKEWADMVLFANYKTMAVRDENDKVKARGGERVLYTQHHPCWDAKNRHGLKEKLKLDFAEIAEHIPQLLPPEDAKAVQPAKAKEDVNPPATAAAPPAPTTSPDAPVDLPKAFKALFDLMKENNVKENEIQMAVAEKGIYPMDTPVMNYDVDYVDGVLVAAWPQVFEAIKAIREDLPF